MSVHMIGWWQGMRGMPLYSLPAPLSIPQPSPTSSFAQFRLLMRSEPVELPAGA